MSNEHHTHLGHGGFLKNSENSGTIKTSKKVRLKDYTYLIFQNYFSAQVKSAIGQHHKIRPNPSCQMTALGES